MAPKKPSLIDKVKSRATTEVKAPAGSSKETFWHPDAKLEPDVEKLIIAGFVAGELKPVFETRQKFVKAKLMELYTDQLWRTKVRPDNPKIVIRKKDKEGKYTESSDMSCNFIVKERCDGLKNWLPKEADLPDGITPRDKLVEALMSPLVGLTAANAKRIAGINVEEVETKGKKKTVETVDEGVGEFLIVEHIEPVDKLDTLYYGDKGVLQSAAQKLIEYITAEPEEGEDFVKLLPFSADEGKIIRTTQQLMLKEGYLSRIAGYCGNLEQLRKLLAFIEVTLVIQNYEFAIGEELPIRNARLEKAVNDIFLKAKKADKEEAVAKSA